MPTGYYQQSKQPVICRHTTMPKLYQFCRVCHVAYWCCAACHHLQRCDTCTQQQAAAADRGTERREGNR
jgi:hypothetical protein